MESGTRRAYRLWIWPTLTLDEVISFLALFLLPVLDALRKGEILTGAWPPGGPWRKDTEKTEI
jgi:hypothetical protein